MKAGGTSGRLRVGLPVVGRVAGWTGVIVRKTKQKSSPWVVRWDRNGLESHENCMSIKERNEVKRCR